MPQGLDLSDILTGQLGQRLLGKPCRDADPHGAGRQFQECEAAGGVEPIQHVADKAADFGAAERVHLADHRAEARLRRRGAVDIGVVVPDQRDGFGKVADIIVGIAEQHGVHALQHQLAQHRRLDIAHLQRAGDGGQAVAAVGIRRVAKIVGQQFQLAIAAGVSTRRSRRSAKAFMKGCPSSIAAACMIETIAAASGPPHPPASSPGLTRGSTAAVRWVLGSRPRMAP